MQPRIGFVTAFFLIATAAVFDGLSFLLTPLIGVGTIVTVFAYILFFVWFALLGVQFMSGKKALQKLGTMGGTAIIDALPVIGGLAPAITVGVVIIIVITYIEDKENAAKLAAKKKASQHAASANRPSHI
jgi:hypothetical protein